MRRDCVARWPGAGSLFSLLQPPHLIVIAAASPFHEIEVLKCPVTKLLIQKWKVWSEVRETGDLFECLGDADRF